MKYREIDLSRGEGHNHPDIDLDKTYLVKVHDRWHFGQFNKQWYGLNFINWGSSGIQFDAPGYNHSHWQRIIEINPEDL